MIIRQFEANEETKRTTDTGAWLSRHLVLAQDKTDFSLHDITFKEGTEANLWYKNHLEAVYCIEGEGILHTRVDEKTYPIRPGTLYILNKNDQHQIHAKTDLRFICVFSPPLTGEEIHDEQGSYPLLTERKSLRRKNVFVIGMNEFNRNALQSIRNAENYDFVPLLKPEDVLERKEYPVESILQEAREKMASYPGPVDGLIHYIDFPVSTIAPILCREFNLPSASLEAVLKCEHKYWSRLEQAKSAPEHVPKFRRFDPFDDNALKKIGLPYPFWIKPIKSFSSYLGFKINNQADWDRAIAETRANIGRFSTPFDWILSQANLPDEIAGIGGGTCIAESIIGGRQCTQEGFVHKGEVKIYGTIDSIREGTSSSFSHYQYPSRLPAPVRKRMAQISEKYIRHIGYNNAPLNIEFFWDANQDQIWLLEANPRISESHTDLFWKVDGASHHEIAVDLSLGQRPRLPYRDGEFGCAGKFFIRRYQDGIVKRTPSSEEIEKLQSALPRTQVKIIPREGQRLSELMDQDSYSYVLAFLWIGATNYQQLQKRYEQAVEMLPFEIASNG